MQPSKEEQSRKTTSDERTKEKERPMGGTISMSRGGAVRRLRTEEREEVKPKSNEYSQVK